MADQEQSITSSAAGDTASVAATQPGGAPPKSAWLPVVVPMRARVADEDSPIIDEWPAPGHTLQPPRPAARSGWMGRLTGRVAVIAAAAAIGGLVGAAAATGMGQMLAAHDVGAAEAVVALRTSIGQLATEIKALKDGVGEGSRAAAGGLASLEDRLAGAEAAQADLTAQIASLSKGLSREPVAATAPVSPEITGSIARGNLPVASDWVLWRVRNGRALVQGNGGYFEVVPGSQLPGLGLVQRIVKEDGRWMVLTRNAVIVARG
jgi:hypothetical protein